MQASKYETSNSSTYVTYISERVRAAHSRSLHVSSHVSHISLFPPDISVHCFCLLPGLGPLRYRYLRVPTDEHYARMPFPLRSGTKRKAVRSHIHLSIACAATVGRKFERRVDNKLFGYVSNSLPILSRFFLSSHIGVRVSKVYPTMAQPSTPT